MTLSENSSHRYCEIIRTHQLPEDWPNLSPRVKKLTVFFSMGFTLTVAYSECISSAYAIQELGYHPGLAYTVGSLSGMACLTAWPQLAELLFELAASKNKPYRTRASEWACKLIAYPLALCSAAQVITDSYYPMVDEFNLTSQGARWGIFAISSFSALSYLSTYSKMGIEGIDDFVGKITDGTCPSIEQSFSFLLSIFGSALLADLGRVRIISFLLSPEIALPFALYDWMIDTLAWTSALYGGTISAYNAYPYVLRMTTTLKNQSITFFKKCYRTCKNEKPNFDEKSTADPPPKIQSNRNTFFSFPPATIPTEPHQNNPPKEETLLIPRESCCTRLMKWLGCY